MRRKKIVPCLFLTVALCGCTTQTVEDAKQIEESKTYVSKYEYETDTDGKTETQAYSEEKPTFTDWETVTGITDPAVDYKEGTVKYKSMNEEFSMGAYEYSVTEAVITKDVELYARYNKTSKQVKSTRYKVENNYIKNIMLSNIYSKYSYKDFISNISQREGFLMYENNKIIDPEYIKTGMVYKNRYKEYKIVLTGDVTGDGLVKMNDVMMIANHLIDNKTLNNEYFYAADLTNDVKVKMNDLMKLANIMISGGSL